MARRRTVKSPPKRGTLTRKEVRLVVRQVVQERRAEEAAQADPTVSTSESPPKTVLVC